MLDIGAPELLVILIILVLIMGPNKLAGIGGSLGKSIREFRKAVQQDDEPHQSEDGAKSDIPASLTSVQPKDDSSVQAPADQKAHS